MASEDCPNCSDHVLPRAMHLKAGEVEAMRGLLDSVNVRPYRPESAAVLSADAVSDFEPGLGLPPGFAAKASLSSSHGYKRPGQFRPNPHLQRARLQFSRNANCHTRKSCRLQSTTL